MKIAFFIDSMNGFGGAQRVISVLCNSFAREGAEVLLVTTGNTDKSVYPLESVKKYAYTGNCGGVINKVKKLRAIRKTVKAFEPDVIVSFLTMTNILTILSMSFTKIPIIISERNDFDKCTSKEKLLSKIFYPYANKMVVQTENIKQQLERFYKKRIEIIPNPLQEFSFEKTDYSASKKMIAVGRITEQKNYPLMLEAFAAFLGERPEYCLHIYGAGNMIETYQALAKKLNISEKVCFMGNKPNPLSLETDADMYVMSSDYEGMPNALAEAMSVGFPCISTDCDGGGAAFLIDNGVNGLLVEKGNPYQLTEAMKKIADDRVFAQEIGQNAKSLKDSLNVERITQMWTDFINCCTK